MVRLSLLFSAFWLLSSALDPSRLDQQWWEEFALEKGALLSEDLKQPLNSLEEQGDRLRAEKLIQQIEAQVKSLEIIKNQEVEDGLAPFVPKEFYLFEDLSEALQRQRSLKESIKEQRGQLQGLEETMNAVKEAARKAFSRYQDQEKPSKEAFLQGLEVINRRLRQEYVEEEIRLGREQLKRSQEELRASDEKVGVIKKRLNLKALDLEMAKRQRQQLQGTFEELSKQRLELEEGIVLIDKSDVTSSYDLRFLNQRLINALAQEAFLGAKILLLQIKPSLVAASNGKNVELQTRKDQLERMQGEQQRWERLTESALQLSAKEIYQQSIDNSHPELLQINQEINQEALSSMSALENLKNQLYDVGLAIQLIEKFETERKAPLEKVGFNLVTYFQSVKKELESALDWVLFEVGEIPITLLGILKAFLIFVISYIISKILRRLMQRLSKRRGLVAQPTLYTFGRVIQYIVILLGTLFALTSLGLTVQNLLIILGALSVGVGFGLQNIVNNFLCGLTILFEKNLKVGDYVELEDGHFGQIVGVNVQNSTIHTYDGEDVLVPNSDIVGKKIVNWTKQDPYLRLHVPFFVAYGSDEEQVVSVVSEVAKQVSYTLANVRGVRDPEVWLREFGESSLNYELVVWVNLLRSRGRRALTAIYLVEIYKALRQHGIEIPFNQLDVKIKEK